MAGFALFEFEKLASRIIYTCMSSLEIWALGQVYGLQTYILII